MARWLPAWFAVLAVVRLWLTGGNEIVSEASDAWSYVAMAELSPFSVVGADPGFPLWLWTWRALGVPQRVAIELFHAAASLVLACGLARAVRVPGCAWFLLPAAMLSPATFFLFDRALSDGFYLSLTFLGVGLAVHALAAFAAVRPSRWLLAAAFGAALGAMAITRKELPILGLAWLLFVAGVYGACAATRKRTALGAAAVAGALALAIGLAPSAIHHGRHGVWTQSTGQMPSHVRLLAHLASIEVPGPQHRRVPVSLAARQLAYAHSPTLARFAPVVEDAANPYRAESERVTGLSGEIGAGWIWHVFNAAAPHVGIRSTRELDASYRRANEEIEAAFADGRLRRRFVIHPLLGRDLAAWGPHWPAALSAVLLRATHAQEPVADGRFRSDVFDRVALRRPALLPPRATALAGWAFAEADTLAAIEVLLGTEAAGGRLDASLIVLATPRDRPDLQGAFAKEGRVVPLASGFAATLPGDAPPAWRLRFTTSGGRVAIAEAVSPGHVRVTQLPGGGRVVAAVDVAPGAPVPRSDPRFDAMVATVTAYRGATWAWIAALALAPGALLLSAWRARLGGDALPCLALLLVTGIAAARVLFYSVVEAAAWDAEPRYVVSAGALLLLAAIAGASSIIFRFRSPVPCAPSRT